MFVNQNPGWQYILHSTVWQLPSTELGARREDDHPKVSNRNVLGLVFVSNLFRESYTRRMVALTSVE
jgi:hypothetical protein